MIYLERHNPSRRIHRFYCLKVEPNLFGEWSMVRTWGRVGRARQTQTELYTSLAAAQGALQRKEREKRRKGYH
jgi:predicted DNA-binding WGR domain protein